MTDERQISLNLPTIGIIAAKLFLQHERNNCQSRKRVMANKTDQLLSQEFVCAKCGQQGAQVKRLAMSGTGFSRLFEMQLNRYAFVSCHNCGYTEVYNLETLEGRDNIGSLLEILFSD